MVGFGGAAAGKLALFEISEQRRLSERVLFQLAQTVAGERRERGCDVDIVSDLFGSFAADNREADARLAEDIPKGIVHRETRQQAALGGHFHGDDAHIPSCRLSHNGVEK